MPAASPAPAVANPPPAATATLSGAALLDVVADSECPDGARVDAILGEILGHPSGERLGERAFVTHSAALLVVALEASDGRRLGERALPADGTCEELARAAAVVLAAWLSDVHPELVPRLPPAAAAEPPRRSPAHVALAPSPVGEVRATGRVEPRANRVTRVSAAVGASVLPVSVALAGVVEGAVVPESSGLGGALRVGVVASRSVAVGDGQARFFRWPLVASAVLCFRSRHVSAEVEGGAAVGWLHLEGRSFATNRSADDVTVGPALALRLVATRGRVRPFAEVAGVLWARRARLYSDAAAPSAALPSVDGGLFAGVALVP